MKDHKLEIVLAAKDITGKAFSQVKSRINSIVKSAFSLQGAFFTLAGGAGFGALVKASLDLNDNLAKTSDRLGLTTEALAGLRHAGELTGVSAKTLDTALQRMTRRISEAAKGSGVAKAALDELGLSAEELARLTPDQALARVADAMGNVESQTDKVRLAFKLFDTDGVKLLNTLDLGARGLNEAAREAKDLGLAINRVDAARIEVANDAFSRAQAAVKGVATIVAVELAPHLEEAATQFANFVKANRDLIQSKVVEYLGKLKTAIENVWKLVQDPAIRAYGVVGLALFGKKGAAVFVGAWHFLTWAQNLSKAFELASEGVISFKEIATANFEELAALVKEHEQIFYKVPQDTDASGRVFSHGKWWPGTMGETEVVGELPGKQGTLDGTDKGVNGSSFTDRFRADAANMKKEFNKAATVMEDIAEQTANTMGNTFHQVLFNGMTGGFNNMEDVARAAFDSILDGLARIIAKMIEAAMLQAMMGMFGGGTVSPIVGATGTTAMFMHGGGIVGRDRSYAKTLDSRLFDEAPRLHSGLRPDEYPAILQRGEAVIPKDQAKTAAHSESKLEIIINEAPPGTKVTEQQQGPNIKQLVIDIASSDVFGGKMDKAIQHRYGIRPRIGLN